MAVCEVSECMGALEILAEIQRLYKQLRALPTFNTYGRTITVEALQATAVLEDQIRTLSDRYKRQTDPRTMTDEDQPRVTDSQVPSRQPLAAATGLHQEDHPVASGVLLRRFLSRCPCSRNVVSGGALPGQTEAELRSPLRFCPLRGSTFGKEAVAGVLGRRTVFGQVEIDTQVGERHLATVSGTPHRRAFR